MERIRLEIGRVVAALPYHNHYVVRFYGEIGTVTAVALDGTGDVRGGAKAGQAYMPGSTVFGAAFTKDHPAYKYFATPHVILGALAPFPLHQKNTNIVPRDIVLDSLSGYDSNQVYKNIINNESTPSLNQDRSYNRATDAVPGDWYKSTAMGGVILLSDFLTRIGASERAFMDFNAVNDSISAQMDALDLDAEVARTRIVNYGDMVLRIESDAFNRSEALGDLTGEGPFVLEEDGDTDSRVVPRSPVQNGFFRHETLTGGPVNGFMRTIRGTPDEAFLPDEAFFPGLLKEHATFGGEYALEAANGIRLEKSVTIRIPYEEREGTDSPVRALGSPFSDEPRPSTDGWAETDPIGFPNPIVPLDDTAPYYDPYKSFEAVDIEGSGELPPNYITVSEASITIDHVGNIILRDAFGSRIAMTGGDIIFSCPGDIRFEPGRDLTETVPRNRISKTRRRVEFTSNLDSIALKAEKNMQLLSGNGGRGSTVIENRAQNINLNNFDQEDLLRGGAIGSGVHIRATNSGVSVLGDYIYGGGYTNRADSSNGIISPGCNILLDAGPGIALIKGRSAALQGTQAVSMSMDATTSGVYVTSGATSIVANAQITNTAPSVVLQSGGGKSVEKPYVNRDGVQVRRASLPSSSPNLSVQGQIVAGAGIAVRGDVAVTGSVGANGTIGKPAQNINVSVPSADPSIAVLAATADIGNLQGYMTDTVGIQTETGQAILEFAFPDSEESSYFSESYKIPLSTWAPRRFSEDDPGFPKWGVDTSVTHSMLETPSRPYPGRGATVKLNNFENEKPVVDYLKDDYSINTSS